MSFITVPIVLASVIFLIIVGIGGCIFMLIRSINRKKLDKLIDSNSNHPYICSKCGYDLLGTIASSINRCPECGFDVVSKSCDTLIAKALILSGRVPTTYRTYHIYKGVERNKRFAYHYEKTIMAENNSVAFEGAKILLNSDLVVVIDAANSLRSKEGGFLIAPILIVSNPVEGLAFQDAMEKTQISISQNSFSK